MCIDPDDDIDEGITPMLMARRWREPRLLPLLLPPLLLLVLPPVLMRFPLTALMPAFAIAPGDIILTDAAAAAAGDLAIMGVDAAAAAADGVDDDDGDGDAKCGVCGSLSTVVREGLRWNTSITGEDGSDSGSARGSEKGDGRPCCCCC